MTMYDNDGEPIDGGIFAEERRKGEQRARQKEQLNRASVLVHAEETKLVSAVAFKDYRDVVEYAKWLESEISAQCPYFKVDEDGKEDCNLIKNAFGVKDGDGR